MPLSIWQYLRERTRDSVLAGFQDALDIVEQDDTEGSQHDAARRLTSRLAGSVVRAENPSPEIKPLPIASMNGAAAASGVTILPRAAAPPPQRPSDASGFDDDLESRLNSAAPQNGRETAPAPSQAAPNRAPGRGRRGRPPKKKEGSQ